LENKFQILYLILTRLIPEAQNIRNSIYTRLHILWTN